MRAQDLIPQAQTSMANSVRLVKVFSATMARDREALGERVTAWIQAHPGAEVIRYVTAQSSDARFHCLSIVLFCGNTAQSFETETPTKPTAR